MDAQGALDSLLGRLTTVLVSEAQLLSGVRGDVEFIKDEMESMNGLLHLTEAQYRDHQVRASSAGLTRDCGGNVELYIHYVGGGGSGGGGVLAFLRRIPRSVRTIAVRHRIATRIREPKDRARDVGDRRLRYGGERDSHPAIVRSTIIVTTRYVDHDYLEGFHHILQLNNLDYSLPGFYKPRALALSKCEHAPIQHVLEECYPHAFALHMFLHLLYVNPYRSKTEMEGLSKALAEHKNNTSRIMLMFCYNELPIKYKTCLQYLSIFPQGHSIRRTRLIRRWLAEGLVTERRLSANKDSGRPVQLEDQAERVFNALIDRGFLRPGETSAAGKIRTCTMHQKIHDFIATDVSSFMDSCLPLDLAHRFSINSGVTLEGPSCSSDILSLLDSLPGSDQWQLLKVLDLEGCTDLKNKNLKNICKILLLKYLSLRNTGVTQLPKKIEKLQCLETLDIRQTKIRAFATKSIFLPMLKHLLASNKGSPSRSDNNSHGFEESPATMELPSGTRRMERLEILSHVDAFNNVNDLIDIGQLLQLRKLGVVLDGKKAGSLALLSKQIEELHGCLLTLSIQINHPATSEGTVPETDKLAALVSPPKLLQSLNISGITSGLPGWITKLDQLTKITLSNTYLGEDAIRVLRKLRILRCLRLRHKSYTGTKLTFNTEEFQHLKSLVVDGCDITNIDFVNIGAAPKLEMIIWTFDSVDALPLSGIEHLPKLKKLELNGDEDMAEMRLIREAHPNCPVFKHNSSHQHEEAGSD
uniref:Uncharacterized protein n=1 Tax=Oryza barthii TaxID=65489 RepID=A0A0D3HPJ7_9ORYZ